MLDATDRSPPTSAADVEEQHSGGTVVRARSPSAAHRILASIAWLSLSGVAEGAGIFQDVNFVQRLETVGGNPPSTPGFLGQVSGSAIHGRLPVLQDSVILRS
jgi:hypothetical protein